MTNFFMLYREGGRSPTVKHSAEGDAKREAERIAREHGGPVYLLEAVARVEVKWESIVVTQQAQAAKLAGEWVDFDIAWAQRKARAEPNGPPTPEQAKAHAAAHNVGGLWGRWLHCASAPNGPPVPVCVDGDGTVVSAPTCRVLLGRAARSIGGKWFPLAIDGSPLSGKDPHDDDIPF